VEPLQGESLSHFLGRFRRANDLTPTDLGKTTGLGGAIAPSLGKVESSCHKIEWQFKVTQGRQHHNLSLLSEYQNCGARVKVPALCVDGWCPGCFMLFAEIAKHQNVM